MGGSIGNSTNSLGCVKTIRCHYKDRIDITTINKLLPIYVTTSFKTMLGISSIDSFIV